MNGIVVTPTVVVMICSISAGVIGLAGFIIGNNRNESKARGRVYTRMDEEIAKLENTTVRKDICDTVHKSVDEKLACIPEIKNKVIQIATKIDIFLEKNGKK